MQLRFTKMQGAGNDFVVLDETRERLNLSVAQYRFLADRHWGVGADQILSVRPAPSPDIDFAYAIHNADGSEVEHCGNGARCFVRFVREQGLTAQTTIRVKTINNILTLMEQPDGRVTVDMGAPFFAHADIPFDRSKALHRPRKSWEMWLLSDVDIAQRATETGAINYELAVVSMGNPHAVQIVPDAHAAPVQTLGPWIETHPAFARRVNAGFMQIVHRGQIKLRVYERGAGETLACGTGACAAVVCGIRLGLLDATVDVHTRGGVLTVHWDMALQGVNAHVLMTGPATTVYTGTVDIPDDLSADFGLEHKI